jgi:hypothetical protein
MTKAEASVDRAKSRRHSLAQRGAGAQPDECADYALHEIDKPKYSASSDRYSVLSFQSLNSQW